LKSSSICSIDKLPVAGPVGLVVAQRDCRAEGLGQAPLDELAEAIHKTKVEFNKLPRMKPVFRLHPPSKGFKGKVKKSYTTGGVTGYRRENINNLVKRMT